MFPDGLKLDAGLEQQVELLVSKPGSESTDPDLISAQNKVRLEVLLEHTFCV